MPRQRTGLRLLTKRYVLISVDDPLARTVRSGAVRDGFDGPTRIEYTIPWGNGREGPLMFSKETGGRGYVVVCACIWVQTMSKGTREPSKVTPSRRPCGPTLTMGTLTTVESLV